MRWTAEDPDAFERKLAENNAARRHRHRHRHRTAGCEDILTPQGREDYERGGIEAVASPILRWTGERLEDVEPVHQNPEPPEPLRLLLFDER